MRIWLTPALVIALAATAASADPMATVQARQHYYKAIGDVMDPMRALLRSYDAEEARALVTRLEAALDVDAAPFYAPGTSDQDFPGTSRALAAIWDNMEDVAAKGDAMHAAAAEVAAAAEAGDARAFAAAFQQLGGSCKSCHDAYRRP